jgi:DNA-binding Xre family transcriptional regulator
VRERVTRQHAGMVGILHLVHIDLRRVVGRVQESVRLSLGLSLSDALIIEDVLEKVNIFWYLFLEYLRTTTKEPIVEALVEKIDGQKLREIRQARHMSQREVALRAEVTNETVNRIERADAPRGVQPRTLRKLAAALDVDPDELVVRD